MKVKVKIVPNLNMSMGLELIPVSLQVIVINPALGCQYCHQACGYLQGIAAISKHQIGCLVTYSVSQKSSPPNTFGIFSLRLSIFP